MRREGGEEGDTVKSWSSSSDWLPAVSHRNRVTSLASEESDLASIGIEVTSLASEKSDLACRALRVHGPTRQIEHQRQPRSMEMRQLGPRTAEAGGGGVACAGGAGDVAGDAAGGCADLALAGTPAPLVPPHMALPGTPCTSDSDRQSPAPCSPPCSRGRRSLPGPGTPHTPSPLGPARPRPWTRV
eukprot:3935905-Rhodomonas_salina.3